MSIVFFALPCKSRHFQIPGLLVEPMLFTLIIYWLTGLRPTIDALGLTLLVVIFTMNVSTACGKYFADLKLFERIVSKKQKIFLNFLRKY